MPNFANIENSSCLYSTKSLATLHFIMKLNYNTVQSLIIIPSTSERTLFQLKVYYGVQRCTTMYNGVQRRYYWI